MVVVKTDYGRSGCSAAILLMVIAAGICLPVRSASADTLQSLRQDVRTSHDSNDEDDEEPKKRKKKKKRSHDHCDDDYDDDDGWGEVTIKVGLFAITSPFWGPAVMLGDEFEPGYFPRHPYQDGIDGHMMIEPWVPMPPRLWSLRSHVEYGHDFDGLSRIGGRFLLDSTSRFGLDSQFDYHYEDLAGGTDDELWTGDFNLVFRIAQTEFAQLRTGLGFNWLSDAAGSDFGFNFTYGGDIFPRDPWIVSAEIDWGHLGHAGLFRGRMTGGVQFHGVEAFTGFEYLDIGGAQIKGPVIGIRFWY